MVIQDECIRKLIVKELKEMKCCNDASLRTSAVESLDIIIGEGIPTFKHILHLGHRQNSK
ncbi:hypothetical protein [Methanobacterium spitsbergense]|uniref:Uncharacterized protein n=1 Tax=Methanobacterium spitsbergense TaxID=2874285 RepID=A0A8T5V1P0_9EURY|nr:hypothetical protein [Methanobacterium spitsbergense]MBZ2166879.1 hypothetical protein [Methanobacterium spitsbergense]